MLRILRILPLAAVLLFVAGCMCNTRPSRVEPPKINPDSATTEAMRKYDSDSNGVLSAAELEQVGSISSGMLVIDQDNDGAVSKQELHALLTSIASGVGRMTFNCQVTLDGRNLAGATVSFTPEPFMQGAILPAIGITDVNGMATIANDPSELPEDQRDLTGTIQPGVYLVEITHPQIRIPARYNTQSTLGQIVLNEVNQQGIALIELKSE